MIPLPLTSELVAIAQRVVWFEAPAQALENLPRFLAYAMTYGTYADIDAIRRQVGDEAMVKALDNAPPGIFDARSWAYWNNMFGRYPTPPLPERRLPATSGQDGVDSSRLG